jgi:hypothetical protein
MAVTDRLIALGNRVRRLGVPPNRADDLSDRLARAEAGLRQMLARVYSLNVFAVHDPADIRYLLALTDEIGRRYPVYDQRLSELARMISTRLTGLATTDEELQLIRPSVREAEITDRCTEKVLAALRKT